MATKAEKAVAAELAMLMGEPPPPATGDFAPARAKLAVLMSELSPKLQRFVASYLSHGEGKRAAIDAGYAPSAAAVRAHRLLHDQLKVAAVVALAKQELAASGAWSVEKAMAAYATAIDDARSDKQHNAVMKGLEGMARLYGLFIDKSEVVITDRPSIRDAMAMAQERLERVIGGDSIDAEFRTIESKATL